MDRLKLGAAVLVRTCACLGAMHVANRADFISGINTNGWIVTGDHWTSPAYPAPVSSFAATGTNLSEGATLSISYGQNRFEIARTGTASLASFTADYETTQLPAPDGLWITNMTEGSFSASWSPVANAAGYRLSFYTNGVEGASDGTVLFSETFANVPAKKSSQSLDPDTFNALTDTHAGWDFENCNYGQECAAIVQIGTASKLGWLSMTVPQNCAGTGRTLHLNAWRHESAGQDMPVLLVSSNGSTTNAISFVTLSKTAADYHLALPELHAGERIYFHSTTNKMGNSKPDGRVMLDTVRVLEGYDPGHAMLDLYATAETSATSFATNGMQAIDGFVTLTALSSVPADNSEETGPAELPLANPPLMPILRAVSIQACLDAEGFYEESFDALSAITAKTDWYNGTWPVPYWMGGNDKGKAVTAIYVGNTNSTYNAFYSVSSGDEPDMGYALGFHSGKDEDGFYGIAFVNDTSAPRENITLECAWVHWNYKNEIILTNTVEYLVTNELVDATAAGNWIGIPSLSFTPPYTASENEYGRTCWRGGDLSTVLPGVTLASREYLVVRFCDRKTGYAKGGAGIQYFRMRSDRKALASYMVIR